MKNIIFLFFETFFGRFQDGFLYTVFYFVKIQGDEQRKIFRNLGAARATFGLRCFSVGCFKFLIMAQTDKNLEKRILTESLEIIEGVFIDEKYPVNFKESVLSYATEALKCGVDPVYLEKALEIACSRCETIGGWWDSKRFIAYTHGVLMNLTKEYVKI